MSLEKSSSCETCEFVLTEVFSVLQDKDDRQAYLSINHSHESVFISKI